MTYNREAEHTSGWSFLATPRWLGYYALIIVFSIACVFLGNWQFERRAEARAEIDRIDANYDAVPVEISEALPTFESFDLDANKWQQVTLTGNYVGDPYLARNRAGAQSVGSLLIHPLQLPDGSIFFVDRGWVDVNAADGVPDTLPMPQAGPVEVTVRLRQSETQLDGRSNQGRTLGSLDLNVLSEEFAQPVYTGAYGQVVTETPRGDTGELPSRPERDEGPHLSYALQWYVFILIAIIGAGYAARLEHRSLNPDAVLAETARKREKPRKLTDAEEEDAYLDA